MDRDAVAALGERLRLIGYDAPRIQRRLGRIPARLTPSVVAVAERRAGDDVLGQAVRLWNLGSTLSTEAAVATFGDVDIEALVGCGLVTATSSEVRAVLRLSPVADRLHAHDFDRGGGLSRDHVVGIGPAALTLSGITPRARVGRALDLGTGCGVQAFGLARHASSVVATDISQRAAWTARLGASLNGLGSLDIRVGDLLEPVAGEDFDLIVCNPPFVVSPAEELAFRDAGERGHALSRGLARSLPARLRPGGVACVLVNWIVPPDVDPAAEVRTWFSDLEADVLLLHHETLDPVAYAQRWAGLPVDADLGTARGFLDRWLTELQRLGAAKVAAGALVIRRTDARPRWRLVRMQNRPSAGGPQVQRIFDALGRFSGPADPALESAVFSLVAGHRVEQRLHYGSAGHVAGPATLRLDRSAGVLATVPAELLEAVFLIDGQRDLLAIAEDLGDSREVSAAAVMHDLAPHVLELFELGYLELRDAHGPT